MYWTGTSCYNESFKPILLFFSFHRSFSHNTKLELVDQLGYMSKPECYSMCIQLKFVNEFLESCPNLKSISLVMICLTYYICIFFHLKETYVSSHCILILSFSLRCCWMVKRSIPRR